GRLRPLRGSSRVHNTSARAYETGWLQRLQTHPTLSGTPVLVDVPLRLTPTRASTAPAERIFPAMTLLCTKSH
ncbi:MAG: hypothetical protein AAFQ63_24155, partial [Cyanobacteria bacterium J06621_11]